MRHRGINNFKVLSQYFILAATGLLVRKVPSQRDRGEPGVLAAAFQELERPQRQRFLAEHVLVALEFAVVDGALAPTVEFPQGAVVGLDEADIVQIHVIRGLGGNSVAFAGGVVVGAGERLGGLEELCALGGGERDGLFEELVEVRVGLCEKGVIQ